jgi:glycerol-3-phosphate O-acyltransferase
MLKGFNPEAERDLVFIPVGINYDRVIEDRSLLRKLDAGATRRSLLGTLGITAAYLSRQLLFTVLGRRYRYGYACVNFGKPMSMREHARANQVDFRTLDDASRRSAVARVGAMLMQQIGGVVPVLPVPLVATVMLGEPTRAMSELELKAAVQSLMQRIEALGAHVYVPRTDRDYALTVGLRMLTLRHLVLEEGGLYRINADETAVLSYYANSIAHLCKRLPAP